MLLNAVQDIDVVLNKIALERYSYSRALWRAVILQAFVDSTSSAKRTETQVERQRAIHWLTEMNKDFILVCRLADYNPCFIRKKALEILSSESNKDMHKILTSVSRAS